MTLQESHYTDRPSYSGSDAAPVGTAIAIFVAMMVIIGAFIGLRPYSYDIPSAAPVNVVAPAPRAMPTTPALPPATVPSGTTASPGLPSGAAPTAPNVPAPPAARVQ